MSEESQTLAERESTSLKNMDPDEVQLTAFGNKLCRHLQAGYQLLVISTAEIYRAEHEIQKVSHKTRRPCIIWDLAKGITDDQNPNGNQSLAQLSRALDAIETDGQYRNAVIILRNAHWVVRQDVESAQKLQTLVEYNSLGQADDQRQLVVVGTNVTWPQTLEPIATHLDFELPEFDEIAVVFSRIQETTREEYGDEPADCTDEQRDSIIRAMLGLSVVEAENVLALSLTIHQALSAEGIIDTIEDHKATLLKKLVSLEYIPKDKIAPVEHVGGYDILKTWTGRRRSCFGPDARARKIDLPRGIVLLGVPGTGKSLVGRVISRILDQPLVRFDVSSVFGSLVGESERKMREALQTVDALQGCVLLVDEADKVWGGVGQSSGDSGVAQRVFGSFLSWLQEKTSPTFVVLTMNRTDGIPPEFLRTGRFDKIFYTDLPTKEERREIMKIHFAKRGDDPEKLFEESVWDDILDKTDQMVGSEIEEVVKSARLDAFYEGRSLPTHEDMLEACRSITTLNELDPDNIGKIREFCKNRARPVSSQGSGPAPRQQRRRRRVRRPSDN